MYRYYQTSDKSEWALVEDTPKVEETAKASGATKLTILSVSEMITEDTNRNNLQYKGPLFFDIDCKQDLPLAADSTSRLVNNLKERGVHDDDIAIFASGSKGFHVTVPQKVFSSGRKLKSLPYVYREMALTLYVSGMDFQVYNGGKGTCWRLENVQRDNGAYRVRITQEELAGLVKDISGYAKMVESPRGTTYPEPPMQNAPSLGALYSYATAQANKKRVRDTVSDEELKTAFEEEYPECIKMFREGKRKNSSSFNKMAFTFATFFTASGQSDGKFYSAAELMAESSESNSYKSARERLENCEGAYRSLQNRNDVFFSCSLARGLLPTNPCEGCSLLEGKNGSDELDESLGLQSFGGAYQRVSKDNVVPISSFVITPKQIVKEGVKGSAKGYEVVGAECEISTTSGEFSQKMVTEKAWKSKAGFLSILEGVEGATFYGGDTDIQKIKHLVFSSKEEEVDTVYEVREAGIHFDTTVTKNAEIPVYVEAGLSINKYGTKGTHRLQENIHHAPKVSDIPIDEDSIKKASEALKLLLQINDKKVTATLVGWVASCHLKAHIIREYKQFPLLSVWGNAGSGKTRTVEMLMWLTGVGSDYDSVSLSLPHTTRFPLIEYVTSTTTIPRVLEEFNQSKLSIKDYNYTHEILKSAFNNHEISRGVLSNSSTSTKKVAATTISMRVTSPLIYVSEQPVESPPLRQRSVSVGMVAEGRDLGTRAFKQLEAIQHDLKPLAKLLTLQALSTPLEEVRRLYKTNEIKSDQLEHRPKFGLQTILIGLDFLLNTCQHYCMSSSTLENIQDLKSEFVASGFNDLIKETEFEGNSTEVDQVLSTMCIMAGLKESDGMMGLERDKDFFVADDKLYLNLLMSFEKYKRHVRNSGDTLVIRSNRQFIKLLSSESYFINTDVVKPEFGRMKLVELSLEKMQDKKVEMLYWVE